MTRTSLIVACAAAAVLAPRAIAGPGESRNRTPRSRPPSMPTYRGRILNVPHSAPRQAVPQAPRRPAAPPRSANEPRRAPVQGRVEPPHANPQAPVQRGAAPQPRRMSAYGGDFRPPERDQAGHPLNARPILDVTRKTELVHQTVADASFARSAQSLIGTPAENDGRYHWHEFNGGRFSHWHDPVRGRDWFGIYQGQTHFWTTLWHDHFWWREPQSGRYLVFWRDHWWWHAPDGTPYVYIDQQYYQWLPNQNGVALVPTEIAPASSGSGEGLIVSSRPEFNYSADGTRMVQVEGEKLSAYLYVTGAAERDGSKPLKFLGDGVTAVAFTDTSKGEPLKIVLSFQNDDGSIRTAVVDANGEPLSGGAPAAPAPPQVEYGTPGAPGYDAPPSDLPPTDAPFPDGQ